MNDEKLTVGKILNPPRYQIKVTEKHLQIIREAVDLYSRLLAGQFENPLWNLFISRDIDYEEFHDACAHLKKLIFPELERHSYYPVGWRTGDSLVKNKRFEELKRGEF